MIRSICLASMASKASVGKLKEHSMVIKMAFKFNLHRYLLGGIWVDSNSFQFEAYDAYLGGSNLIANSSDMVFLLKHGAKSSSSKSPWHPVSVATFFFTERGSLWIAHGESAEPLSRIARCIKSGTVTKTVC